tara:strand:- start:201 stop:1505 length:1305 start_codon:yes stop_codon:yes gene_type:complete
VVDRIDCLDSKLGAFQAVYADDARLAADAADKAMRIGHQVGPFHGTPFALKDLVDVEGRITTSWSAEMSQRLSPSTATIARRLVAAGGILIGKTKTTQVAMGGWGANHHMGTPWNQWDLETPRTPDGSSSGSGVAVAAGLVPCAVGIDTGGSVRMPSAWCGSVGLKVTEGFLPTDGIIPCSHTHDTPDPMTRTTTDAAFMFDVMAGADAGRLERNLASLEVWETEHPPSIRGLRLGSLRKQDLEDVEPEIFTLYDDGLDRQWLLGAEIAPYEPPAPYEVMLDGNGLIFTAEAYAHHGPMMENPHARVDEDIRRKALMGHSILAHTYIAACLARQSHIAAFKESMQELAAIVTPTLATAPIPLAQLDQGAIPSRFTRWVNYLATCALAVPMGLTAQNLPGGLHIVTAPENESMALRIGAAFEREIGSIGPPPGLV